MSKVNVTDRTTFGAGLLDRMIYGPISGSPTDDGQSTALFSALGFLLRYIGGDSGHFGLAHIGHLLMVFVVIRYVTRIV